MLTGQSLDFIQLAAIDGIRRCIADFARSHVGDLVAAIVEAGTRQAYRIAGIRRDGHTVVVDDGVAHSDRTVVT